MNGSAGRALRTAALGVVAALAAPAASSGAGEVPASSQPTDCFWLRHRANYPDAGAVYWRRGFALPDGAVLTLRGRYPYARYMSFTAYNPVAEALDTLTDRDIAPTAGSANPFRIGAARKRARRSYSVRIVADPPPAGRRRAANTLYLGSAGMPARTGWVMHRIYVPDAGGSVTGGVPLPRVTLRLGDGRRLTGTAACRTLDQGRPPELRSALDQLSALPPAELDAIVRPPGSAPTHPGEDPLHWERFFNTAYTLSVFLRNTPRAGERRAIDTALRGGIFNEPAIAYVFAFAHRGNGPVLAIEGRAPRTPRTQSGPRRTPRGDLRYWSLCVNPFTGGYAQVRCVHDENVIVRGAARRYRIVLSDPRARPRNATARCGVTWMPWGRDDLRMLILRHQLPAPGFRSAVQNVPRPGAEARVMGAYLPRGHHSTTRAFEARGCRTRPGRRGVP